MKKQLHTLNLSSANTFAVILLAVSFLPAILFNVLVMKIGFVYITGKVYFEMLLIIALFFAGLAAHEGLHALCGILFGKQSKQDIEFGMKLKLGIIYCHMKKPMKAGVYRIILIVPLIVTGLIPLIISAVFGNFFLIIVFAVLFSGGAGDLIMLFNLRKVDKETCVLDHPSAAAYYLCYEEGKEPADFAETTETSEKEQIEKAENTVKKETGKKSQLLKTILVFAFLAVTVLLVYLLATFSKSF